VLISRTLLAFSADTTLVSPNGDGRLDTATFDVSLASPSPATLTLDAGTTHTPIFAGDLAQGDQQVPWSGTATDGSVVPDGAYRAMLTLGTPPLSVSQWVPLTVDTVAPTLTLMSLYPLRLKLDERQAGGLPARVPRDDPPAARRRARQGRKRIRARHLPAPLIQLS
jgi:hypothetical protein